MNPESSIAAVFLDADGVVQLPARDWRAKLDSVCPMADRTDAFLADIFSAEDACLTGERDFENELSCVLERWGGEGSIDAVLEIWTRVEPDGEVLELVGELRRNGIRVALATNQQRRRAVDMSKRYASIFDDLFFSCELGHAKPSTGFFLATLEAATMAAHRVLFLDDNEKNVTAARSVGMRAEVVHLGEGARFFRKILRSYGVTVA